MNICCVILEMHCAITMKCQLGCNVYKPSESCFNSPKCLVKVPPERVTTHYCVWHCNYYYNKSTQSEGKKPRLASLSRMAIMFHSAFHAFRVCDALRVNNIICSVESAAAVAVDVDVETARNETQRRRCENQIATCLQNGYL